MPGSKLTKAPPTKKATATSGNKLGDMSRTIIEGLTSLTSHASSIKGPPPSKQPTEKGASKSVPSRALTEKVASKAVPSRTPSKASSSSRPATRVSRGPELPQMIPSGRSKPGSLAPSVLKTPYDIKMASRQPTIDQMPPTEQAEQEQWAQEQLKMHGKTCPGARDWVRTSNGYTCKAGICNVTHELLAEGRGGILLKARKSKDKWIGPLYGQDIMDAIRREGK